MCCVLLHTQGQVARVNAYRASCNISICVSTLPTQHTTCIYNDSSNTIDDGECSSFFGNSTECYESSTNVYCAIEIVSFPRDEFVERPRNFLVYCARVRIPVLKQAPYGEFYITGSKIINSQRSKKLKCGLECGCTVEFCAWKGSYLFFFTPLKVCGVIVWHMVH